MMVLRSTKTISRMFLPHCLRHFRIQAGGSGGKIAAQFSQGNHGPVLGFNCNHSIFGDGARTFAIGEDHLFDEVRAD